MIAFLIAFALYILVLVGIGVYGYHQTKKSDSFGAENRTMNYWITALSALAADMGVYLFFGLPGAVYLSNTETWTVFGLVGGMWATWHFIAPKLRTATEEHGSSTLTHFLCSVAGDRNGYLTVISSALLTFFFIFYIAAAFSGIGSIITYAFGTPYWVGVVGCALLVTFYISIGGYMTVALADAFQGVFLLSMVIIVPLITAWRLAKTGDFVGTVDCAALLPTTSAIGAGLIAAVNWGLGYVGMPHILTKFMGIDSVKNMKKAQRLGLTFQALALSSSAAIGLLARWYFTTPPASAEKLFLHLVMEQCAPLLAGFILCAVTAAAISSLDAQLIVCASVIARDLCKAKTAVQEKFITRLSTLLIAGIGATIALTNTSTMYSMVRYAWSGLGSTFGPLVIMSLYAPQRLTVRSALVGILVGGFTAALWPYYGPFIQTAPLIPGFCTGLLAMYLLPG
ncbi:MAG: solute:Na+ symporter, family [Candidatus Dependentiae bacterium]|nr:solute:Na+ symporter, family [Candidatus Dependentiae bacterium]